MQDFIYSQLKKSCEIKYKILNDPFLVSLIRKVSEIAIQIFQNKKKILIAGNGGSAADAQHIAGEFVSKFYFDRPGLSCIALTTDTSILTAIGNDYGYENIFARQIQANGNSGDLFIGISTSGNSANIINALNECKDRGLITVGLTGISGGEMAKSCDYCIKVPSDETPRIQEAHIMIGHIICSVVEEVLFGRGF